MPRNRPRLRCVLHRYQGLMLLLSLLLEVSLAGGAAPLTGRTRLPVPESSRENSTVHDALVVEVYTDKPSYVLGESVTITLDLSLRKLTANGAALDIEPFFREQPPHLQLPWFASLGDWKTEPVETFVRPLLGQGRAGFTINDYHDSGSVFQWHKLVFTLPRRSTTRTMATGETAAYFTYQLRKHFWPTRPGTQTIPPVLAQATLPTRINAQGQALATEQFSAHSAPRTVEIRPVPLAEQPSSFTGAVGRFRLVVQAAPAVLKVGDPLTLTVTLRNEGDSLVASIRPPQLQQQPVFVQDFKLPAETPASNTGPDFKTFTYVLRPRHAEVRAVPSLAVAYFDPHDGRYHVLNSAPIPLRVEKAMPLQVADVIMPVAGTPGAHSVERQLPEGIGANYTGPEVLVPQYFQIRFTPLLTGLLVLPPLVYIVMRRGRRWRQRRPQHPEQQRTQQAGQRALAALRALQAQSASRGDTSPWEGVYRILTDYISATLTLNVAGLTSAEILAYLQRRGIEPSLIHRATEIFHLCDCARYAPGTLVMAQLPELFADATALIQQMEKRQSL